MKKLQISLLCILAATFISCEKDYTCQCRLTDPKTGQYQNSSTEKGTFKTKSEAESWCKSYEKLSASWTTLTCTLK